MPQATVSHTTSPTLVEVGSLWMPGRLRFSPREELFPGNMFGIKKLAPKLAGIVQEPGAEGVTHQGTVKILRLEGKPGERFRVTNADLLKHGDPYLSWWQACMVHLPPGSGWRPDAILGLKGQLGLWVIMPPGSPHNIIQIRSRYDWVSGEGHALGCVPEGPVFQWDVGTFFVVR